MGRYLVAALVALSGCSFDLAQEPVSDVEVSWQITMAGAAIACGDVEASTVRVTFDAPAGHRFADWFPCAPGAGVARFLPVEDYTVTATAIADDGFELGVAPSVVVEISDDEAMRVPQFEFQFDAAGPSQPLLQ